MDGDYLHRRTVTGCGAERGQLLFQVARAENHSGLFCAFGLRLFITAYMW
jgi:hypothetical protein